jgi:hypothetical protein
MADTQTPNEVADEVVDAPSIGTMNLSDRIVADSNSAMVQSSNTQVQLLKDMGVVDGIIKETIRLQEQTAQDRALVTATEKAADLKAEQYRIQVANKAGVDPTQASDFLLDTVGKFTQAAKKVQERQAIVTEKQDSSLLDNPVKWIFDGLTLGSAKKELKESIAETNVYGQQIAQISSIVGQASNISLQIKESTTAASADAASRIASNEALVNAQKTAFDGIRYNTEALNVSMGMTKDRLAIQYNVKQAKQQEEAQRIVLERFAQDKMEFDVRKSERDAAVKAKEEGKSLDQYQIEMINTGRAARGLPPLTENGVKSQLQIFRAGGKGSEELHMDYQNGERTAVTGNTFIGASPSESVNNIKNHQFNFPPGVERTLKILKDADDALQLDPKMQGVKDQKLRDQYIDRFVQERVRQMATAPNKTPDNIFYTGDLSNYFAVPSVKELKVVQKFLEPASKAGVKLDNPSDVFTLAASAVKKGQISSTEFQELATVYQMANNLALRAANPLGFGVVLPEGGSRLTAKISPWGDPVDITNPTELGRHLSKHLAEAMTVQKAVGNASDPRAIFERQQRARNPFAVNQGQ